MSVLRTIGILTLLGGGATTVAYLPSVMAPETGDDTAAPVVASVEPASRMATPATTVSRASYTRARLDELFAGSDGSPEAIATLAATLIRELEGDPLAMARDANLISESASRAMNAPRFVRVAIAEGFSLPQGTLGWDFGPADAPATPGFQRVSPGDIRAQGIGFGTVHASEGSGLFSNGITNLRRFDAEVPNQEYRVIVLTGEGDRQQQTATTFDGTLRINGRIVPTARTAVGLATTATVAVTDGQLSVELPNGGGAGFIAGIVLEPIGGPSVLGPSGLAPDPEQILAAEAIIANAMAELFEMVVAVAGDETTRAQILELSEPPVQDVQTVSES